MKTYGIAGLLLFATFFTITSFMSCDDSLEDSIPNETLLLTEAEQSNLLFMREEEKLARDVYIHFYEKYEINIFSNISSSEQYHMDAVLVIMEKYGVEDPASDENGVFANPTIPELYDSLISKGDVSSVDALKASATIEDVDIRDLRVSIAATSKDDLIKLYEMMIRISFLRQKLKSNSSILVAVTEIQII
jgi:hypothetical protein